MNGNPLFTAMQGNAPSMAQMLQQIKQNPASILGAKFNLPRGVNLSDPNAILNHLVQTGQVSQERYNAAFRQAQQLGMK